MILTIPQNKQYLQNNRTNIFPLGNLWSTFGIDLQSNVGVLRISPRLMINTSTTDDADLGCPVAFRWFDNRVWAICDTRIFKNTGNPSTAFTEDASTGVPTDFTADESDMEIFNNTLCVTTTDALVSKVGNGTGTGAWTDRDVLNSGNPHMLTYFKKFDRLYYTNGIENILSISTAWVTADPGSDYAISLSSTQLEYRIFCIEAASQNIWIGTCNIVTQGQPGKVCVWDGISAQVTTEYQLSNAVACMAIAFHPQDEIPYIMDSNGVLSRFNGGGFTEVGRLPFPYSQLPYNPTDADNERFIHPNGMYFTKDGTLRCLINNRANYGNVVENISSGTWEWSSENGFVHVQPFSYTPVGGSTITDWGQNKVSRVGALVPMNIPITSAVNGTIMVGATIYTNASSTTSAIFTDNSLDTVQKKGYIGTDWIESNQVADSWDRLWTTFRKFLSATDSIVFKYRIEDVAPSYGDMTWVNTISFTILNSAVDISAYWTSGTGGEVEILNGTGSGLCAHITNAVNVAGTWTVTIDETATGVTTGTASARFQKWIKLFPAEALSSTSTWAQWAIDTTSTPRIQLKGCFTFTGAGEFYKSFITSSEDIKATKTK